MWRVYVGGRVGFWISSCITLLKKESQMQNSKAWPWLKNLKGNKKKMEIQLEAQNPLSQENQEK